MATNLDINFEKRIKHSIQVEDTRNGQQEGTGVTIILLETIEGFPQGVPLAIHRSEKFKRKDKEGDFLMNLMQDLITFYANKSQSGQTIKGMASFEKADIQTQSQKQMDITLLKFYESGAIRDDVTVFKNEIGNIDAQLITIFDDKELKSQSRKIRLKSNVYRKLKEDISHSKEEFGYEFKGLEHKKIRFDANKLDEEFTKNFLYNAIDKHFTILTNIDDY
jgi:hypothetical protein